MVVGDEFTPGAACAYKCIRLQAVNRSPTIFPLNSLARVLTKWCIMGFFVPILRCRGFHTNYVERNNSSLIWRGLLSEARQRHQGLAVVSLPCFWQKSPSYQTENIVKVSQKIVCEKWYHCSLALHLKKAPSHQAENIVKVAQKLVCEKCTIVSEKFPLYIRLKIFLR